MDTNEQPFEDEPAKKPVGFPEIVGGGIAGIAGFMAAGHMHIAARAAEHGIEDVWGVTERLVKGLSHPDPRVKEGSELAGEYFRQITSATLPEYARIIGAALACAVVTGFFINAIRNNTDTPSPVIDTASAELSQVHVIPKQDMYRNRN
jgi:hypothetical protein